MQAAVQDNSTHRHRRTALGVGEADVPLEREAREDPAVECLLHLVLEQGRVGAQGVRGGDVDSVAWIRLQKEQLRCGECGGVGDEA